MYMFQYTLVRGIAPEKLKPCPEDLSIEYFHSPDQQPGYKATGPIPAYYPPILLRNRGSYHVLIGKEHIDYYIDKDLPLPYGLAVERGGSLPEFFQKLIQVKKELYGFNAVEKAVAMKKLFALTKPHEADTCALLDIPKSEGMIRKYLLLADASDRIKSLILTGKISEFTAFEIFQFDRDEWDEVASFVSLLSLGTRKRNEIVTMLFDITRRDNKSVVEILRCNGIVSILGSHIDSPQKGQGVYEHIYSLRFPRIHEYRKRFFLLLRETGIERYAHLEIPRDFEKWLFKLDFSFGSLEEFRKNISYLGKTANDPCFKELLDMRTLKRP